MTTEADAEDSANLFKRVAGSSLAQIIVGVALLSFQVQKLNERMERMESGNAITQTTVALLSQDVNTFKAVRVTRDVEIADIRRQMSSLSERLIKLEAERPFVRSRQ